MRFVNEHPQHPVDLVLRVLDIASSTFYGWLKQAKHPSARRGADEGLLAAIVEIHTCSGGTYSAPRVHAMLRRLARDRILVRTACCRPGRRGRGGSPEPRVMGSAWLTGG